MNYKLQYFHVRKNNSNTIKSIDTTQRKTYECIHLHVDTGDLKVITS